MSSPVPTLHVDDDDAMRVTIVSVLVVTCNVLPVALLGALSNPMGQELGFGEASFGLMVSIFFVLSALISLLIGPSVERWGPTFSMRASAGAGALGMLVIVVLGNSWGMVTFGLLITAFGMSVGTPAANLALARRVRASRRGFAFGLKQASAPAGSMLAGLSVPLIAITFGWRAALVFGIVISLVVMVLVPNVDGPTARKLDHVPGRRRADGSRPEMRSKPWTIWAAGIGFAFGNIGASSLAMFVVPTAIAVGIDIATAGTILAVSSATGIVSRIIAGWWADRRGGGHLRVVALMLFVGAGGYALIGIGTSAIALTIGAMIGFIAGWGWNGLFALAIVEENPSAPAVATGRVQVGGLTGSAVGPLIFGWLAEFRGFGTAWAAVVLLVTVSSAIMGYTHLLVGRQAREEQETREEQDVTDAADDARPRDEG